MAEIRTIRSGEAEEFLRLLCGVFGLDFRRALDVFFQEPLFDLNRKWATFESGKIVCTLTTVPLIFGDGPAIGIAGVATEPENRGRNLATELLKETLRHSDSIGEGRALLFASFERLYERCGFEPLDQVVTQPLPTGRKSSKLDFINRDEIRPIYDQWAEGKPTRLRRDERRWNYWGWNLKTAYRLSNGYVCYEFGRVREILKEFTELPIADPADWFGLKSLGQNLKIPLTDPRQEMLLMGRGFDYIPEMFLTDQF